MARRPDRCLAGSPGVCGFALEASLGRVGATGVDGGEAALQTPRSSGAGGVPRVEPPGCSVCDELL